MKFKTTEWTITAAAAAHVVRQAGNTKMAAHLDDLAAWLLRHLAELEAMDDAPPFDPAPESLQKACPHCGRWIHKARLLCPHCRKRQIRRD